MSIDLEQLQEAMKAGQVTGRDVAAAPEGEIVRVDSFPDGKTFFYEEDENGEPQIMMKMSREEFEEFKKHWRNMLES